MKRPGETGAALALVTETVGDQAFFTIAKVLVDGPPGLINLSAWLATGPSRPLTEDEAGAASHLAESIRKQSERVLWGLLTDGAVRAALTKSWGQGLANKRKPSVDPVADAARASPKVPALALARSLVKSGVLREEGEFYFVAATGRTFAVGSLAAKVSRARKSPPKDLRIT